MKTRIFFIFIIYTFSIFLLNTNIVECTPLFEVKKIIAACPPEKFIKLYKHNPEVLRMLSMLDKHVLIFDLQQHTAEIMRNKEIFHGFTHGCLDTNYCRFLSDIDFKGNPNKQFISLLGYHNINIKELILTCAEPQLKSHILNFYHPQLYQLHNDIMNNENIIKLIELKK